MRKNSFFLWPDPHFSLYSSFSFASTGDVEAAFVAMYPGAIPVIFSSARASISAILELLQTGRADKVWCPPFSSHCVLESVSRVATPSTILEECRSAIVYHQWGYIHAMTGKDICIEDSADSFLLPGNIRFPNNGKFQIVSLPKIYGCAGGGVVFCKDAHDAEKLRLIRDGRNSHSWLQFFLKLAGNFSRAAIQYWGGAEAGGGRPTAPVCKDILRGLERTEKLIRDRQEKLSLLRSNAPGWLQFSDDRLPCAVPVELSKANDRQLTMNGHTISPRHFNVGQNANNANFVKVLPIPIHQDFSLSDIESFLKEIG